MAACRRCDRRMQLVVDHAGGHAGCRTRAVRRRGERYPVAAALGPVTECAMSKSSGSDSKNTLYCSFCGKSQHEVRKLIAGPTVFICDECVELCMDIIREEHKTHAGQVARRRADAARDLQGARRLRDRPGPRQARALGRGAQPLQAAGARRARTTTSSCRSRTSCWSARPAAARRCWRRRWRASSTCRSPWPTPRR